MSRSHRQWVVGVVVAAAFVLLFAKSGTIVAQPAGGGVSDWVKIGPYRINGNKIVYTLDEANLLVVHFGVGGATSERIVLRGAEAAAMRRWLDARASDPLNAGKTPAPPPAP